MGIAVTAKGDSEVVAMLTLRPVQMFVQKVKRSFAVDGVRADEPFDLAVVAQASVAQASVAQASVAQASVAQASVAQAESSFIEIADLGEFVTHGLIGGDGVEMA